MANAYTDIVSGTSLGKNLVQTAYDRLVEFALRSMPTYRAIVDKRPAQQSMPGSSVVFNIYQDLARVTSALNEIVDPDAVAVPSTNPVTVTLGEWGNAALVTRKLRLFSLSDVDPAIADIIAYNMVDSIDWQILGFARQGTNVSQEVAGALKVVGGAVNLITATDTFKSRDARAAVTLLRGRNSLPRDEELYTAFIHPNVSYDLRTESDLAAWRPPHEYSAAENIWAGAIGAYEGSMFIETPRCYTATDGASSAVVYRTLFFGRQALAEAVAEEPHVIIGPTVDKLMRFRPVGWYGVLGWNRYREESIHRFETASSLG